MNDVNLIARRVNKRPQFQVIKPLTVNSELKVYYIPSPNQSCNNNNNNNNWWRSLAVTRWSRISINVVTLRRARTVGTWMGDRVRAGKSSRYVASQLGRLSLLPSVGW